MGTLLSLRIQEQFERLTRSEQKLARVLLDRSDEILNFSARELAQFSQVSPATAARLFKSLGYSDFNEVRLQARQERNRTGPTTTVAVAIDRLPTGAATISGHLHFEQANLARTFESLRSDRLSQVADLLATARRLCIAALGNEAALARLAGGMFARARAGVHVLPEDSESWPAELATLGPGEVLLVIAAAPWPKAIQPLLEFCQTARVKVVVITDPASQARVERRGAIPLVCHALQASQSPSWTAVVSMIALLHLATLDRLGDQAPIRAELIDGLREKFLAS